MARPKDKLPLAPEASSPFHNPFAALAGVSAPEASEAAPPASPPARPPRPDDLSDVPRATVRRERKGRGGKTVTLVQNLGLPAERLTALAKALRQALGCGANVEGEEVVVQGDQTDRVVTFLEQNGVRRVSR
ncbi:MAG TPA: translation initiation factor [Myxococcota bacterium]|nr:translation initiation factor [Myxococcota bacterium]